MKSLNNVQLIGCIGNDPEITKLNGKTVAKFSIATGEEWMDKVTTEKKSTTEWHKVVCFNKLAEIFSTYIKKGAKVYISGRLKTSKWQDNNKENRYMTEIIADELIMLSNKTNTN